MTQSDENNKYIISHLVAASENNVIGQGNQLPWSLPDDFKYFKNKTWGMVVIMGRKTYESLSKPLPGRTNIVVTKDKQWNVDGVIVSHDIAEAVKAAKATYCKELFIIGGGELFRQTQEIVNRIYITRVHASFEGDTFYPPIDPSKWKLLSQDQHEKNEKHQYPFTFEIWERTSQIDK